MQKKSNKKTGRILPETNQDTKWIADAYASYDLKKAQIAFNKQVVDSLDRVFLDKSSGIKHDDGKLPLSLIPKEAIDGLARGLQYGARKYAKHNWAKGMDWSRVYDAGMRHMTAWNAGEDKDPESGLSHLDHALCCLAFLAAYESRGTGNDDRYKS